MMRRHQRMQVGPLIALALAGLLGCPLAAQEARVRVVDKVAMPTQVDSNSPAFWRDGRLNWFGSHGRPWLSEGRDQFGPWEKREISVEGANPWPLYPPTSPAQPGVGRQRPESSDLTARR